MQRWKIAVAGTAVLVLLTNVSVMSQGKGGSKPAAPKQSVQPATKPTAPKPSPATKPQAPKAAQNTKQQAPKAAQTTKPQPTKPTHTAKAEAPKPTKPVKSTATATASAAKPKAKTATTTATTTTTSTPVATTTPGATTATTLSAAQQKLQRNTNLASKLQSRLPAGTDLMQAAAGFRNLGQFVAAVNVSNNLNIPFTQLRTKMVDGKMSLGQAIQALKPSASATIEAQRADYDARGMISESEQAPATAPTTSKKTNKHSSSGGSQ